MVTKLAGTSPRRQPQLRTGEERPTMDLDCWRILFQAPGRSHRPVSGVVSGHVLVGAGWWCVELDSRLAWAEPSAWLSRRLAF